MKRLEVFITIKNVTDGEEGSGTFPTYPIGMFFESQNRDAGEIEREAKAFSHSAQLVINGLRGLSKL